MGCVEGLDGKERAVVVPGTVAGHSVMLQEEGMRGDGHMDGNIGGMSHCCWAFAGGLVALEACGAEYT